MMESLTITLPERLRRHVEERAAAAGFATPSEFIRELIEREIGRGERDRLETLALEGLGSGPMIEMDDAWWARKYAEFDRRFGAAE